MNRENTFSLTVMVIIMALLAIFVGYLLGNWLIQLVTGTSPNTQQVVEKKIVKEDTIKDNTNSVDPSTLTPAPSEQKDNQESNTVDNYQSQDQLQGDVFVIQVGAFNSYNNAVKLKEELAEKGFQAVITEGTPFKVQLGASNNREDAEKTEEEIKGLGYDAFITH